MSDYPATQRSKPEAGPTAATRCSRRPAGGQDPASHRQTGGNANGSFAG